MNDLLRRLRLQRIDGRSDHDTMRDAATAIEELEAKVFEIDALRARVAELEADAERFAWVLPIVLGDDDATADAHAMALALHLCRNLTGRAAIDAAMRDADNKSAQCFSTEGDERR